MKILIFVKFIYTESLVFIFNLRLFISNSRYFKDHGPWLWFGNALPNLLIRISEDAESTL